jgi:hypothetical protein
MRELLAAELLETVVPEYHDAQLLGPLEDFLAALDRDPAMADRGQLGHRPARRGCSDPGTTMHLHTGKLSDIVAGGLVARNLARRVDGDWYEVESLVANRYMAFLAASLGARTRMQPITDQLNALAAFSADPLESPVKKLVQQLRPLVLEAALPAPTSAPSVTELASFKEEGQDILSTFRRTIEKKLLDLALVSDEWARGEKLDQLRAELDEQIKEIQARMHKRRWTPGLGAFCTVAAVGVPALANAVGHDFGGAGLEIPGFVSAVLSARRQLSSGPRWRDSPLAYAALARERL